MATANLKQTLMHRGWWLGASSCGVMALLTEWCSSDSFGPKRINTTTQCEEVFLDPRSDSFRILVVGSGLTGSLTALRIRQRLDSERANVHIPQEDPIPQHQKKIKMSNPTVEIYVVERASYPSGRFGAMAYHQTCVADIGAQVLSTVNPNDPRALAGHGVALADLQLSNSIVQDLLLAELVQPAPDQSLADTDERMIWEDLWQHYFPTRSMKVILQFLLQNAKARPIFGVRVDSIEVDNSDGKIQVKGISRVAQSANNDSNMTENPYMHTYDCVVLCIPAPDVCAISGVLGMLDADSRKVLVNVGYDQRTCEAHFFSSKLLPSLAQSFGSNIELNVNEENSIMEKPIIQYISLQNAKRHQPTNLTDKTCSVVLHTEAGILFPPETLKTSLDKELSKLTGLSEAEISSYRLKSKSISWKTSQMIRPMEAIFADPPRDWQCLKNTSGSLILAGDYMTQSSFLGCIATADAAARAVLDVISRDVPKI